MISVYLLLDFTALEIFRGDRMLRCAMRVRTRISVSVSCGLRPQAAHPIRPCREISSEGTSCEEAGGIENSKAGAVRVYDRAFWNM